MGNFPLIILSCTSLDVNTAVSIFLSCKSVKIRVMLQRYVIHFALIFLFAFTQIGVATHEISHLSDQGQHSQQDPESQSKSTVAEQCSQCISYAKVANGLALDDFVIPKISAETTSTPSYFFSTLTQSVTAYSARAPPQVTSI